MIGEASDGLEAIVKAGELKPDLVLMDIQMPGCDGLEACRQIKKDWPNIVVVMLTVRDDEEKLFQAIKNGAQGYLLKNMHSNELIGMLRGALAGEAAVSPRLAGRMLEEFRRLSEKPLPAPPDDTAELTPRELAVLDRVAQGLTDKEIAAALSLSVHTVKTHLRSILAKLQVNGRREAARLAKDKGLL